jgi:hypothetical protein
MNLNFSTKDETPGHSVFKPSENTIKSAENKQKI